jgi:formylglycine-generating enzyme required for sulfatase activity
MSVEVFLSTPEICERLPADYVQVFESIGQMKRDLHDKEKEDPVATTALEIADDVRHQEEYVFPSFYMDIFEVTNKQYKQFMQAVQHDKHLPQIIQGVAPGERHPGRVVYDLWSDRKRNLDFQPVTCVSGEDAAAYAAWAGKSLPTRLQWEYAASGGKHIFPWGDDFKSSYCCSKVYDFSRGVLGLPVYLSSAVPSTVGAFNHDRSMFGCFDLAGNASEWVLSESGCYKLVGGNAGSFQVLELVPSKTDFFVETPTLYGFRTVLNLPTGEPSEDPPQHPGPK